MLASFRTTLRSSSFRPGGQSVPGSRHTPVSPVGTLSVFCFQPDASGSAPDAPGDLTRLLLSVLCCAAAQVRAEEVCPDVGVAIRAGQLVKPFLVEQSFDRSKPSRKLPSWMVHRATDFARRRETGRLIVPPLMDSFLQETS